MKTENIITYFIRFVVSKSNNPPPTPIIKSFVKYDIFPVF